MDDHRCRIVQVDQVVLVSILNSQSALTPTLLVNPSERRSHIGGRCVEIHFLLRLCIHKSVSQEQFFGFEKLVFLGQVCPPDSHGTGLAPCSQSLLVLAQLPDKRDSYLQIGSPRVQKLQCLDHGPVIFPHEVGRQGTGRAALAPDRVHQNTLTALGSRVNEVKYLVRHLVVRVEQYLVLLVHPVESQIGDTDVFPHVAHRIACAVHNVCDLISCYEFKILQIKEFSSSISVTYTACRFDTYLS